MNQKAASDAGGAYVSVLGFLSEDAQAALFRYLPHLEACVDKEVAAFGRDLRDDLAARVNSTSVAFGECLDRLDGQAEDTRTTLSGLPKEVREEVAGVAKVVADLRTAAAESTTLLRRVAAFGNRVAEFSERRTPDGLAWALQDVKESHDRWCVAVLGAETAASPFAVTLENITGRFEDLNGVLAAESAPKDEGEAASASPAQASAGEESAGGAEELAGTSGDPSAPAVSSDLSGGGAGARDTAGCIRELTTLVWQLAVDLQAEQTGRVGALGVQLERLRQKAGRLSEGNDAVDRLQSAARDAKRSIEGATDDFRAAVSSGIAAAHLDLLGESDRTEDPQRRRR